MTNIAKPTVKWEPSECRMVGCSHKAHYLGLCEHHWDWLNGRERTPLAVVSSAPQEPDALRRLVEESLYHLRLDDRAKDYHERALAALEGKTLASKGRCHCGFWPCPTHQIDDISERPAEAQEPVADDDAIHDFLREIYGRAHDEGAEDTIEQCAAEGREPPSKPHKDCKNEGAYQFIEDVKPKLIALLDRLPSQST